MFFVPQVKEFGIRCERYEVLKISPNPNVVTAMELEVSARPLVVALSAAHAVLAIRLLPNASDAKS